MVRRLRKAVRAGDSDEHAVATIGRVEEAIQRDYAEDARLVDCLIEESEACYRICDLGPGVD